MSRTVVLDEYGHCINQLTQWDLNRTIVIDDYEYDIAPVVHFCNRSSDESLPVESELSNKKVTAKIPNILLERTDTILVYICLCDSDKNVLETINYFELPIRRRPKPKDYVYVQNTDYIRISDLKNELEKFKNNSEESFRGIESEFNNIKSNINTIINDTNSAKNNANKAAESANQIKSTIEEALNNGLFDGADGTSIVGAQIIENDLIVSLSNGETINTGKVRDNAKKYGVCYDMNTKNPKLTRLGDAKYLRAEIANGADDTDIVNDFDKIYPWSDIKRCTMADDATITSYEGDPEYTENGSMGQVMTEIPEHYEMKYISEATGKMYYYVSREKLNEHYKYVPTKYIGSFLVSGIAADTEIGDSCGGNYYSWLFKNTEARSIATARGENWHLFDIWDYETIKTLFLIEFATLDSQSLFDGSDIENTFDVTLYPNEECMKDVLSESNEIADTEFEITSFVSSEDVYCIGDEVQFECISNNTPDELDFTESTERDTFYYAVRKIIAAEPIDRELYPDYPDAIRYYISGNAVTIGKSIWSFCNFNRNGQANEIKASSGKILYLGNEIASIWRGIENFTSLETLIWLDGILCYQGRYYVCDDVNKYANTIYAHDEYGNTTERYQYHALSFECPKTGYISKMGYDEATGLTMPIETGGTSDTGYCDNFAISTNKGYIIPVAFGGGNTEATGLFRTIATLTPTTLRNAQYYARISYFKNKEAS